MTTMETMANTIFTKGSTVEVSSNEEGFKGAYYVATFIDTTDLSPTKTRSTSKKQKQKQKQNNKTGYIVEYTTLLDDEDPNKPLTEVVDPAFVRPSPPDNGVDGFEVYDVVDGFHRDGWWVGVVKSVSVEGDVKKYVVEFENPNEVFEFDKGSLRLHVDWVDCKWVVPPKKTPEPESGFTTPSKGAQIPVVANETVGQPTSAKKNTRSRKRSESNSAADSSSVGNDIHHDSTAVGREIIVAQTPESESGQKRKRGRRPKFVVQTPIGLVQDEHGFTADIDEQPLSVWYHGIHPFSVLRRNSRFSTLGNQGNSLSQAIVTTTATTPTPTTPNTIDHQQEYQRDWPFVKRSAIWASAESPESYLTPSQKPHFAPLKEMKEGVREGFAIGYIVTFGNLVDNLSAVKPNDPVDIINAILETSCDLETHGFDVGPIRDRLNKLLAIKSKAGEHEDTLKEFEKKLETCNQVKSVVQKKMDELKEEMAKTESTMKTTEEESKKLESNLHLVSKQIKDLEVAFVELAASPL